MLIRRLIASRVEVAPLAPGRYSSDPVTTPADTPEIARLRARVAALEAALERRSRELRLVQKHLCSRDLVVVSRVSAGLPLAKGAYDPVLWLETTEVTEADIQETLQDLWVAVTPAAAGDGAP
jgi:hypothetical protein